MQSAKLNEDQILTTAPAVSTKRGLAVDPHRAKFEQCYSKCAIQMKVTRMIQLAVADNYDLFNLQQIKEILLKTDEVYKFSKEFNQASNVRYALWKRGYHS